MRDTLLLLIAIAFTETIVQCFSDGEALRKTVRLVGGAAAAIAILSSLLQFDYAAYAASLREELLTVQPDTEQAQTEASRLNRLLIEEECAAYIWDRARAIGIALQDVKVTLAWDPAGFWYPAQAELTVSSDATQSSALSDVIQTELGIAPDAQHWREDGQKNELEDTG